MVKTKPSSCTSLSPSGWDSFIGNPYFAHGSWTSNQKPCICSTYLTGGCRGYPGPDTVSGKTECTHAGYMDMKKKKGATNNTLLIRWIVINVGPVLSGCILAPNIKKRCCTECLPWATTDLLDPLAHSTTPFFFSFYLWVGFTGGTQPITIKRSPRYSIWHVNCDTLRWRFSV